MRREELVRLSILNRLDTLIDEMAKPLPLLHRLSWPKNDNGSWSEPTRRQWRDELVRLRQRVAGGETAFEWEGHHLIRALDHDGVSEGKWVDDLAAIQQGLRLLWELDRRR